MEGKVDNIERDKLVKNEARKLAYQRVMFVVSVLALVVTLAAFIHQYQTNLIKQNEQNQITSEVKTENNSSTTDPFFNNKNPDSNSGGQ